MKAGGGNVGEKQGQVDGMQAFSHNLQCPGTFVAGRTTALISRHSPDYYWTLGLTRRRKAMRGGAKRTSQPVLPRILPDKRPSMPESEPVQGGRADGWRPPVRNHGIS